VPIKLTEYVPTSDELVAVTVIKKLVVSIVTNDNVGLNA
jgi:hypothetical protein